MAPTPTEKLEPTMDGRELPEQILLMLEEKERLSSLEIAEKLGEEHQKVVGAVKSLNSLDGVCLFLKRPFEICHIWASFQMIQSEQLSEKRLELTGEGREVAEKGSHEAVLFHSIPPDGILQAEIMVHWIREAEIIHSQGVIPIQLRAPLTYRKINKMDLRPRQKLDRDKKIVTP